jgi:hypothetical protein
MTQTVSDTRKAAARVAKVLVAKNRAEEAVAILAAWAAVGPNDAEGQELLGEALQIDSRAALAKMTFERMEGIQGDHAALEAAIAKYGSDEVEKLEKELTRPVFRRAQLGFNNEIKYKGKVFHVQTEDSGLDKPHVITHLFADGGRIIRSFKRTYADKVEEADVATFVKALMKGQHMEMVLELRDGKLDAILEGKEPGGKMSVLAEPPKVDIQRLGKGKKGDGESRAPAQPALAANAAAAPGPTAAASSAAATAAPVPAPKAAKSRFRVHVLRSMSQGGPDVYEPVGDEALIGAEGAVALPGDHFCHPREAIFRWREDHLWLEDLDGGNGVFLRIKKAVELAIGDEFIVGDQLLRIDKVPTFNHTPGPGPTYCYSSPVRVSSFRVLQIFEGGAEGGCILARGTTLYIGSGYNDMIIRADPLVSEHHCLLDEQAGAIILTDLGSKTGVFVRIRGTQELHHGDEIMIGRSRLLLDTKAS